MYRVFAATSQIRKTELNYHLVRYIYRKNHSCSNGFKSQKTRSVHRQTCLCAPFQSREEICQQQIWILQSGFRTLCRILKQCSCRSIRSIRNFRNYYKKHFLKERVFIIRERNGKILINELSLLICKPGFWLQIKWLNDINANDFLIQPVTPDIIQKRITLFLPKLIDHCIRTENPTGRFGTSLQIPLSIIKLRSRHTYQNHSNHRP